MSILVGLFATQLIVDSWLWFLYKWTIVIKSKHYYRKIQQAQKMQSVVNIWINEFLLWTITREDIQIIFEGEDMKVNEKSQVIICNHRSIIDYTMIQHLFGAENVVFASWRRLMKYPSLIHFWSIFRNNENAAVSVSTFKKYKGLEKIVVFPEVNIFTPEVKLIERKLMKVKCKGLPVLHNVLYPRFGTFVNLIKALTNETSKRGLRMLEHLILPSKCDYQESINLVSLTIIYYTISLKPSGEYKLEQTLPALWDIWSLESPLIICVHSTNHNLDKLGRKKQTQLESWLETQWCAKDRLIESMELNVEVI